MTRIEYKKGELLNDNIFIKEVETKNSRRRALFRCKCGNKFETMIQKVKSGWTKGCGCIRIQHGQSRTRLGGILEGMNQRCYNPNSKPFKNYGGRGIVICSEWKNNPSSFFEWALSNGYNNDLTIDRINNDGNYTPENCRFITRTQQNQNTRFNVVNENDVKLLRLDFKNRTIGKMGFYKQKAIKYNCSWETISDIVNKKTWKNI